MKRPYFYALLFGVLVTIVIAVEYYRASTCVRIIRSDTTIEVWKHSNLLLEFTPRNTDSASMQTLRYLEKVANEKAPAN